LARLDCISLPPKNYPIRALAKLLGTHTDCCVALSEDASWSLQAHHRKQPGVSHTVETQ